MNLPSGTVTFLFTDIEGSTKRWENNPERMSVLLARHDVLMRDAIESNNGVVFKTVGDAFCAVFATASDALDAALVAQLTMMNEPWPEQDALRVRMALHTGAAERRDNDYFGPPLNRVARLLATGHGGQTLLSSAAQELTRDQMPSQTALAPLGLHRLKDLNRPETVFQLLHPALPAEFPPLKSLDNIALNNLPRLTTSFVGREKELADIQTLLTKTRLLTLTGIGGNGKTRLSLQIGADVLEQYPDGVWFVELAALTDPALVPQAVGSVLKVSESSSETTTSALVADLRPKRLLLILDNCEHLVAACAQLADALLKACPNVRILASSREALGVPGEVIYRVPSLALPSKTQSPTPESLSQYEAVRLFIERAMLARPDFTVTNQNAPALAQICVQLDGIPLALELAAARVRSLTLEQINQRLDDRFRLLTGGSRTVLPRQQTLRALVDWSYNLLNEREQELLRSLSAFVGGWTLEAAEAIGASDTIEDWEVLDLLISLVDKSMVVPEMEINANQPRYRYLETVRQYAAEHLSTSGEVETVRMRHRAYFLRLAEEAEPGLWGAEQTQWMKRLEADQDNLRAAMDWHDDAASLQMAGALWRFWSIRGQIREGRARLNRVLNAPDAQARDEFRAKALNGAGVLARYQNDYEAGRAFLEEGLAIQRGLNDLRRTVVILNNLASIDYVQGNIDAAKACYEECVSLSREISDTQGMAIAYGNLSFMARDQGDKLQARELLKSALALMREIGDSYNMTVALLDLADMALDADDRNEARVMYRESLELCRELGDSSGIADALSGCAALSADGQPSAAARLWGAATALYDALEVPSSQEDQDTRAGRIQPARAQLSESEWTEAETSGRALPLDAAITEALAATEG